MAMPEIRNGDQTVTQITVVESEPGKQAEALALMAERARFMARQPGFVSISLHRSEDGSHIVNYVQWKSRQQLEAAHHAPEFRKIWPKFGELVSEAEPCLYEVVHSEQAA
jgi:quinol monooxygenase YgiN